MSISPLFNIPGSESDFHIFSFHDLDMHRQIVETIAATRNIILPLYPTDPIPLNDIAGWAEIHQAMHNDLTRVLGIVGSDFSVLDPNDPSELSSWVFLHAQEMYQAATMLGLS
jgi:hypothetical protein